MKELIEDSLKKFRKDVSLVTSPYLTKLDYVEPDFIGWRDFKRDGTSLSYCSNEIFEKNKPNIKDTSIHYMQEILWLNKQNFKIILRVPDFAQNRFLKQLKDMDMCNSIIIYKRNDDIIQIFCFIFKSQNISAMNFFINQRERFEIIAEQCFKDLVPIAHKYTLLREKLFSIEQASSLFENNLFLGKQQIHYMLSSRQKECLELINQGATNKDIANILNICPKTVEYHLKKIRYAFQCHTLFEIKQKLKQQIN